MEFRAPPPPARASISTPWSVTRWWSGLSSAPFGVASRLRSTRLAGRDALARRGREGPAALMRVLARRQESANGSDLETRFEQLCRTAGVSGLRRQVPIGPYVTDFADPARRVVVELDGLETHATSQALQADLTRQNFLVLQGWTVLRFRERRRTTCSLLRLSPGMILPIRASSSSPFPHVGRRRQPGGGCGRHAHERLVRGQRRGPSVRRLPSARAQVRRHGGAAGPVRPGVVPAEARRRACQ